MARCRAISASNSRPSRIARLVIHSQMRKTMTPAIVPYVLLYDPKLAT